MSSISNIAITSILSIQTLSTCLTSTIGQYIYAFFLDIYPTHSNGTRNGTDEFHRFYLVRAITANSSQCEKSDVDVVDNDAQAWAQQRSADLFFWTSLCSSIPVIIMTYLLGIYVNQLGKRFVLILTMIGAATQFGIWLTIIYFQLAQYWWYIASMISGLTGSSGVLTFVLTLIITDNTLPTDLSSYFVRLGAIQTGLSSIATFAIGYYINWRGFLDLYWIGFVLQIISILIVVFAIRNVDLNIPERQSLLPNSIDEQFKEISPRRCAYFFQSCTIFRVNRTRPKKSISLHLILFSNIFYNLASSTFAPFLWFLLNAPFCWTSRDIGNYSALASISYAVLSVLGMQALTNAGASDPMICLLSHIFFGLSSLWLAFARHDWELYAGLFISAFSGYQSSLTMSMMSLWLDAHERTHAFTLITEINTIITSLGTSLFNWVYSQTVVRFRNFTLLLGAAFCIVPFLLNLFLYLLTRNLSDENLVSVHKDLEPTPIRFPSQVPPHAGDANCIVIPSRSLTSSLRTPRSDRSRRNSSNDDSSDLMTRSLPDDLIVL